MTNGYEHKISECVANVGSDNYDACLTLAQTLFDDEGEGFFDLIDLLVDNYSQNRDAKDDEYFCCLAIFSAGISLLKTAILQKDGEAEELWEAVQDALITCVFQPDDHKTDLDLQSDLIELLLNSNIDINDELKAATLEAFEDMSDLESDLEDTDFSELFKEFVEEGVECPFDVVEILQAQFRTIPAEAQVMFVQEMAQSDIPLIHDAAVLMLLHSDDDVRPEVPRILKQFFTPKSCSPVSLRRMIGLRNWLPEEERANLDDLIRTMKEDGVECAPWPTADHVDVYAGEFSEEGPEGIAIVTTNGNSKSVVSILANEADGFSQCVVVEDLEAKEIEELIKDMLEDWEEPEVDLDYLNESIPFYLGIMIENDEVPPVNLLKVAERVGVSDWHPEFAEAE